MALAKIFVVFVLSILIVGVFGATVVRKQRSAAETDNEKTPEKDKVTEVCHNNTPCGWAVYKPFTRSIEYFIKNRCVCPGEKKCVRVDDDLSISAYVYRCRHGVIPSGDQ